MLVGICNLKISDCAQYRYLLSEYDRHHTILQDPVVRVARGVMPVTAGPGHRSR